ncbi:hypothetical protein FA15DRAFT_369312 [Coprinopsis marcescibilis]|uniref:Uncharacterized protein n=1 Tax=Coprinopsis marcescibilis TaxID=230819 RepID=A0A5C3KXS8_COPMA|nr:hypothetical protein FA15DRAFT_369312 [Coprinopsis marcescibilis]
MKLPFALNLLPVCIQESHLATSRLVLSPCSLSNTEYDHGNAFAKLTLATIYDRGLLWDFSLSHLLHLLDESPPGTAMHCIASLFQLSNLNPATILQ